MRKVTLLFFPNKLKQNAKSQKIPIYLRIVFDRRKTETRLNCELTFEQLSKWNSLIMRLEEKSNYINSYLSSLEQKLEKLYILNDYNLNNYSSNSIKEYLLGCCTKQNPLLIDYVRNYFSKSVINNSQFVAGTKRNYQKSINHLVKFLESTGRKNILLRNTNNEVALAFKDYLLEDFPDRKGMTEVSASSIIKKIKPMIERAVNEEYLNKNPFKAIKLKSKSPRRDQLTIMQVKKLVLLKIDPASVLNLYRDYFLFSVFTGLAYKDLVGLKSSEILPIEENNSCIERGRAKTDVFTQVVLVNQAKEIYAITHKKLIEAKNRFQSFLNSNLNEDIE